MAGIAVTRPVCPTAPRRMVAITPDVARARARPAGRSTPPAGGPAAESVFGRA